MAKQREITRRYARMLLGLVAAPCVACGGGPEVEAERVGEARGEIGECVTMTFGTKTPSQPHFYEEAGYRVKSLYPSDPHVHLLGSTLKNHGGCCSTPYEFTRIDGQPFTPKRMTVTSISGSNSLVAPVASNLATAAITSTGNFEFPPDFEDVPSFQWSATGDTIIDDLVLCSGGMDSFRYDREAAATAAWGLAKVMEDANAQSTWPANIPELDQNSAQFISLSLFAGGFPMMKFDYGGDETTNLGWYAEAKDGVVQPKTNIWKAHNSTPKPDPDSDARLVGYVSGSSNAGGHVITYDRAVERKIYKAIDAHANPDAIDRLNGKLVTIGVKTGDYLFINAGDGHGSLVVGWGPSVRCDSPGLVTLGQNGPSFPIGMVQPSTLLTTRKNQPVTMSPYVADFSTNKRSGAGSDTTQLQTPRPYYCTNQDMNEDDPGRSYFDHDRWMFYLLPDSGTFLTSGKPDSNHGPVNYEHVPHEDAGFTVDANGVTLTP